MGNTVFKNFGYLFRTKIKKLKYPMKSSKPELECLYKACFRCRRCRIPKKQFKEIEAHRAHDPDEIVRDYTHPQIGTYTHLDMTKMQTYPHHLKLLSIKIARDLRHEGAFRRWLRTVLVGQQGLSFRR